MNFSYYIPTRILFGKGQLSNLSAQELPGKKAMIVTSCGGSMEKYGYLARVQEQLKKAGVDYVVYNKILPNPIKDHVMEAAQLVRETGCDFILGLGGGSSIDSAKAIAVMAPNTGDYWDFISGGTGKDITPPVDPLPVVAITTTAGTGTEADPWTVITKSETNEKIGGGYDKTFPVLSIVDPDLMMSVPPVLTAYQGFDALFHSTEGYLNNTANVMSDMYALKSIELIGKSLAQAVHHGDDQQARADVALANTLAGMVESTSGCISEHSLAHAMSALSPQLVHGAALIMISREYYTRFIEMGACPERFVQMAKALGKADACRPMDFVDALVSLLESCGVDGLKMSDYFSLEDLKAISQNSRDTMGSLYSKDPMVLSAEDELIVLKKSYK